jgi:hypothetical protein
VKEGEGETCMGCGAVLGAVLPWSCEAGAALEDDARPAAVASPASVQEEKERLVEPGRPKGRRGGWAD